MKSRRIFAALPLLLTAAGCGAAADPQENAGKQTARDTELSDDVAQDSLGQIMTSSPTPIDTSSNNPFFQIFGTNGRSCGTCHVEAAGWTITPAYVQSQPASSPLFVFDGSDCLPPGVANQNPVANSTVMLSRASVRIDLPIPPNADFALTSYSDPLGCPNPPSASDIRMYRRPLPAANSAFLSTVMWDGRENVNPPNDTPALVQADLEDQANGATLGHAQASAPLTSTQQQQIMTFESNLFNAQKMVGSRQLDSYGGNGGGDFLFTDTLPSFYVGINDVLGCTVPNSCAPGTTASFDNVVFTLFSGWETNPPPHDAQAAAIGRGEAIFNTRSFQIDDVPGINGPNDGALGLPNPMTGFCGTCHDTPNVGNHSTSLPIDIGVTAADPVGGLDVTGLPTYTFTTLDGTRSVTVTDPGRALVTGKFADIGKTKGPNLRGLASRAPYFHNGSAKDLTAVVNFYNARFHIGLSAQDTGDLVAFLQAL